MSKEDNPVMPTPNLVAGSYPVCVKCKGGVMIPLSDFWSSGGGGATAEIRFRAWICNNPACHYTIRLKGTDIVVGEPVVKPAARQDRLR